MKGHEVFQECEKITHGTCLRIISLYNALPWWQRLRKRNKNVAIDAIREAWRMADDIIVKGA